MSGFDEVASLVDDDGSMIKYFREKIIGRPGIFPRTGDLPNDDTESSIKRTSSQDSLDDLIPTNTNSNDATTQVEKLTTATTSTITSGRRPITSSSPIIIPRKPPRSNASSQSSSSYTSVADQTPSVGEFDDVSNTNFATFSSNCQLLEHSAARDRISVKNKRRQPIKQKLTTLRETDDNEIDLFSLKTEAISSTPEEDSIVTVSTRIEPKVQQPLIDLSDLDAARSRLRMSVRPRDRSADNILLTTHTPVEVIPSNPLPILPKLTSPMQRSVSFKRPQEINKGELVNRPILKSKPEEKPLDHEISTSENENSKNSSATQSMSRSPSQEHIYDNLDVFKRSKPTEDDVSTTPMVKTREHPLPIPRLRPVTMHIPTNNDKQTTNEFENVFNQLKKRGSIRRVRPTPTEEPISEPSPLPPPLQSTPAPVEETPAPAPQFENEPIVTVIKPIETAQLPPTPNRRKTLGGVYLPANNKVASDDNKPTPSWVDIAKQKQNKFSHSASNEKSSQNESEQQILIEPVIRKPNVSTADIRSNRKSMFEQSTSQNTAHVIERDSIRALKAGNPNRINNLIQFFDK